MATEIRPILRVPPPAVFGAVAGATSGYSEIAAHWQPPEPDHTVSIDQVCSQLTGLLDTAVREHWPDDEAGLCLSGGLDSTTIGAFAGDAGLPLRTYSMVFPGAPNDEREYIEIMTGRLGVPSRMIDMSQERPAAYFDRLSRLDFIPGAQTDYQVDVLARALQADGVRYWVDGVGGDFTLTGFIYYLADRFRAGRWLSAVLDTIGRLDPYARLRSPRLLAHRFYAAIVAPPGSGMWLRRSVRGSIDWLAESAREVALDAAAQLRRLVRHHGYARAFRLALVQAWGTGQGNALVEQLTARFGLQTRSPLLDQALIDHAFRVPDELLLFGRQDKGALRRTMRNRLPSAITARRAATRHDSVARHGADFLERLGSTSTWRLVEFDLLNRTELDHAVDRCQTLGQIDRHLYRLLRAEAWLDRWIGS